MSEWQPIETAPKDGEPVLLYKPNERMVGSYVTVGWWSPDDGEGGGVWHDKTGCLGYFSRIAEAKQGYPTHWMPLPQPPVNHDNRRRGPSTNDTTGGQP